VTRRNEAPMQAFLGRVRFKTQAIRRISARLQILWLPKIIAVRNSPRLVSISMSTASSV